MTKSHNSCKTRSFAKTNLYCHPHVMLVTVCEYVQNPSRSVGLAHTRFWDVRTDVQTCRGHNKFRGDNLNKMQAIILLVYCTST